MKGSVERLPQFLNTLWILKLWNCELFGRVFWSSLSSFWNIRQIVLLLTFGAAVFIIAVAKLNKNNRKKLEKDNLLNQIQHGAASLAGENWDWQMLWGF